VAKPDPGRPVGSWLPQVAPTLGTTQESPWPLKFGDKTSTVPLPPLMEQHLHEWQDQVGGHCVAQQVCTHGGLLQVLEQCPSEPGGPHIASSSAPSAL
jgi:hypothetical protein